MRRSCGQWCLQMNGFIFGTCVLSYQSHPYKKSAHIPVIIESWCGYETVVRMIFLFSTGVIIPLHEHVCIKSVFNLVSKVIKVALVWLFFAS